MTTDELNAIVQAVMTELEKAGVDFDFKAETPQADDLVYVMRGTADRYMGITVKWQNLLDIIVQKATEAKNEAVSAKDIALQTLATIQGIESNVSSMKSSVDASEANVTQMKSDVSMMKASVEGTKTEVENIKEETAGLLGTKADVTYVDGELAKKVNYTDALTYEEIMATNPVPDLTNKVASANALKEVATLDLLWENASPTSEFKSQGISFPNAKYKFLYFEFRQNAGLDRYCFYLMRHDNLDSLVNTISYDNLRIFIRAMTVSNNNVSFSGGYRSDTYASYTTDDTILIPYRIYGVK